MTTQDSEYFAGIDIGSTAIKIVLIDASDRMVGNTICPTGSHYHENTLAALDELLARVAIRREQVVYTISTGYGRKLFKEADESISEITANAVAARRVGRASGRVNTVINIGGQDLKAIRLDVDGHVVDFTMNDKCAAGTGRFLEMTARNLEIGVEEMGEWHTKATGLPITINSTCTVFAESEIIGLLATGHGRAEVIAGVHYSIAKRVARLAKRVGLEDLIFFDGGPAMNVGLAQALEDELMHRVEVPEVPQITTALGAALLAREAHEYEGEAVNA